VHGQRRIPHAHEYADLGLTDQVIEAGLGARQQALGGIFPPGADRI
jgi:hypothetical protein